MPLPALTGKAALLSIMALVLSLAADPIIPSPKDPNEPARPFAGPIEDCRGPFQENPELIYPDSLRAREIEGLVVLDVLLTDRQTPKFAGVSEPSGHEEFDQAALSYICSKRFENVAPQAGWIRVPVRFVLKDSNPVVD